MKKQEWAKRYEYLLALTYIYALSMLRLRLLKSSFRLTQYCLLILHVLITACYANQEPPLTKYYQGDGHRVTM